MYQPYGGGQYAAPGGFGGYPGQNFNPQPTYASPFSAAPTYGAPPGYQNSGRDVYQQTGGRENANPYGAAPGYQQGASPFAAAPGYQNGPTPRTDNAGYQPYASPYAAPEAAPYGQPYGGQPYGGRMLDAQQAYLQAAQAPVRSRDDYATAAAPSQFAPAAQYAPPPALRPERPQPERPSALPGPPLAPAQRPVPMPGQRGPPQVMAEPDPDDDPNRLPTFVKVRGLPAEHDPRIVRRAKAKKKRAAGCC